MSDYTVGDTIYHIFTTRQFSDGVPTVLSGTPVVSAYEDDSATQITAGITLGVSHDSVVGMNLLTVVATGANGYESGKDYNLVITTGTVGGVSVVGEAVWHFSLGRSAAAVDLANGTDGLGAIKADSAAILVDTADMQPRVVAIEIDTSTTLDGKIDTIDTNVDSLLVDTADMQPRVVAIEIDTASLNDTKVPQTLNLTASGNIGIDWANVENPTTALDLSGTDIQLVDTTATNTDMRGTDGVDTATMRGTDSAALASVVTEARLAELDAANLPSDVDAILVDTNSLNDTKVPDTISLNAIRDAILPTSNAALSNIEFLFVAASDHVTPVTAASTISGSRSIDGGAFTAVSGTIAEVGNGIYQFDALATDMNGGIITFRFIATGGTPGAPDDTFVTVVTGAGV